MGRERERPIPSGEEEREGTTGKKDYPSVRPSVTSVRRLGRKVGQAGAGEGPTEANETAKQRKWRGSREKNERAEVSVTCGGQRSN